MSVTHKNFYENIAEATMRLHKTMVVYDGEPYYVYQIAEHKDGVFRVYLEPIADYGSKTSPNREIRRQDPYGNGLTPAVIDKFMEDNKDCTILRKKINSPAFNKFRPFSLGMVNTGETGQGKCFFVERQPQRQTSQGLINSMLIESQITCGQGFQTQQGLNFVNMYSEAFRATVLGIYPTAKDCLDALMDSEVTNEALAFNRLFAFVRGPLDVIYLAYKDEIVARLPDDNLSQIQLGRKFRHLKEAVNELGIFGAVKQ